MKINIITHFNGVGLSHDAELLKALLSGHEVNYIQTINNADFKTRAGNGKPADINIFLEHLRADLFRFAPVNYFIPNPEWTPIEYVKLLKSVHILCKTYDCQKVFKDYKTTYIGFTSTDKFIPDYPSDKEYMLHLAGKSSHKNTNAVIDCFKRYEMPSKLLLIQHNKPLVEHKQIMHVNRYMTADATQQILNMCQVHICPSEYEGFGHYINEARSVNACIISTDAAPMNELTTNETGYLIKPIRFYKHHMGNMAIVDANGVYDACIKANDNTIQNSRAVYLKEKKEFETRFLNLINN